MDSRVRVPNARGLRRERLAVVMSQIVEHRVATVVAPAGSGKTTALAQFAATVSESGRAGVAWYTADALDGNVETFLAYLRQAIVVAGGDIDDQPWATALDAALAIDRLATPMVIVIDDFHLLGGEGAEDVLGEIVRRLPPTVSLAIGSRVSPRIDLSKLRVADEVLEVDADDLRFRTWEAERLLHDTFGLLLQPDDVARLTRQVGGWAAGFQLFRLAAQDRSPSEQRRLARSTSTRSQLSRQYLAQNLLGALPPAHRDFLVHTSVLGVLTGELADDLLERSGSDTILGQLEASDIFVARLDDTTYRYHEVLRSHLEAELADIMPPDELTAQYMRAAELLEAAGHYSEAVRCHVRSGHRVGIERLLQHVGSELAMHETVNVASLIGATPLSGGDPWIDLVQARADVVAGRFQRAIEGYRRAEERFSSMPPAATCRRERSDLEAFIEPAERPPANWVGALRRGLQSDPIGAAAELADSDHAEASIAGGLVLLVAGLYEEAAAQFEASLLADQPPDWAIDAARVGRQLTRLTMGVGDRSATQTLVDRLMARLDSTWIGRLALPLSAAAIDAIHDDIAAATAERCLDDGDPWGAAIGFVFAGVNALGTPLADGLFERALELAEAQRSDVLGASALAGLALVRPDQGVELRSRAVRSARRAGLRTPPIDLLVAVRDGRRQPAPVAAPDRDEPPSAPPSEPPTTVAPTIAVTTRCFGEFQVAPSHTAIDRLRPQARAVLMRLALDTGHVVALDTLVDDVWGPTAATSASRSLQVAVSAIRRALADDHADRTVDRIDGGYLLTTPPTGSCDVVEFRELAAIGMGGGGATAESIVEAAATAMQLARGQLLVEAGSADWIVAARAHIDQLGARLAARGASAALELDQPLRALELSERGLQFDRYDDGLWRTAIAAHERRGDTAAMRRLQQRYHDVIAELDVTSTPVSPWTGTRAR